MRSEKNRVAGIFGWALITSVACGGPTKPPTAADHDPVPIEGTASPNASPPKSAMAAEVQKGVEAINRKDFADAKTIFSRVTEKEPANAEAQFYLGVALENAKDKKGAAAAYEAALKTKRDFEEAASNLSALYIDEGRFDDALRVLIAIDPEKRKSASLALNLGIAQASKDDRAKAKVAFDAARRFAPADPIVALTYGQWLGKWKDPGAAAMLKGAADSAPSDVGVLASAGFELKNVGAFSECVQVLDKAIELKDAAELRTYRALCKLGLKNKKGAEADLLVATRTDPEYAPAIFYLAGRYGESGDFKKAAEFYERYLRLAPEGPLAKTAKERVKLARDKMKK